MAPTTQKMLGVPEVGKPWKLYTEWPVPTLGPNDLLVKIVSAALNPADWRIQENFMGVSILAKKWPFIGGLDGAGIVEEVGSAVTAFAKGDKVIAPGSFEQEHATFQEYNIVAAADAAKIPENISFDQAATLPVAVSTVASGIWAHEQGSRSVNFPAPWEEDGSTKFAGKAAFIVGGAGSVGQIAIQFARLGGFSPIITTASLHNTEYLKSLGATYIIDRNLPDATILAELQKLTEGKPIVYAFDAIGYEATQELAYAAVAPGGAVVTVNPAADVALKEKVQRDGSAKAVGVCFGDLRIPPHRKLGDELYGRLTEWLEKGLIVPNRVEVIPGGLLGIPEGCDRIKHNKVSGVKLVVHPQETE
ncbi:GroES-like protein [Lentinus tigrinus ALCF2SS1-7]|uniref:GroES-like protein n=1 Tax=Lentinus tigrinus ALCF2SS1-6 TaxID=1328759 RepID=A0A5C2S3E3_9APHY|nr:GroES-like protein [Lentinus tigrinus ALCF2SS1-6]RPD70468.1 GroES-like protein [Lentinus tigrinus ALCF2SS1-7]